MALPVPSLVIAEDMTITTINSACEALLGASRKYLNGKALTDFVIEGSVVIETIIQARARGLSVVQHDVSMVWLDKTHHLGMIQATQVGRNSGNIMLMLNSRSLAEKMDKSLGYRTAARSVTGMAAMLAHEIRNPLAGIKGAAQLLAMNLPDDERELTELIETEATRIGSLVERVEQFGDMRPAERQAVNIHDVLRKAVTAAKAGYAADARLNEFYDPSLPPTAADPAQLQQVFQNLLKNAAEAIPPVGGVISIHTSYRPGVKLSLPGVKSNGVPLEVLIIDNGKGVPPELLENIYEPFVSSKVNGSGLGLSLVSKVLTDHGGIIECDTKEGRTVFQVLLPVWDGADGEQVQVG